MKSLLQGMGLGFPESKVAAPPLSTGAREQLNSFTSKAFTSTHPRGQGGVQLPPIYPEENIGLTSPPLGLWGQEGGALNWQNSGRPCECTHATAFLT